MASSEGVAGERRESLLPREPSERLGALASLVVDVTGGTATRDGRVLRLLPKQFALLVYLLRNPNRIVSRQAIARDVWGDETATWTNVITVNVNGLRKELEREGLPTLLHTVRGQGYYFGEMPRS